jgi:hypothetical protein
MSINRQIIHFFFFPLDLLCFLRAPRGSLTVSMALRAGIALGRAVATDFPGKGRSSEGGCSPSDSPSRRRPEAKKIQGKAITRRCISNERRAASHGEMNQNMIILRAIIQRSLTGDFSHPRPPLQWTQLLSLAGRSQGDERLPTSRICISVAPKTPRSGGGSAPD